LPTFPGASALMPSALSFTRAAGRSGRIRGTRTVKRGGNLAAAHSGANSSVRLLPSVFPFNYPISASMA